MNIKIIGIGSYIPDNVATNEDFRNHNFFDDRGVRLDDENESIIKKFTAITGINERRYLTRELVTSDMAYLAAEKAIENSKIDKEDLDYIIVAHNYGDVPYGTSQSDTVPSLATRVKHKLKIRNSNCVAYDVIFGCPGWVAGVIQAYAFIKAGIASKCLVIGAEALSRVVDPHDRDSMIYSDGAGATVIVATTEKGCIKSHYSATFSEEEAQFIYFGESYNLAQKDQRRYIKMYGRKIYEFALNKVPTAMQECLKRSSYGIDDVKKIFIHQANEKMDEAILHRFYKLYDKTPPTNVMPMNIGKLGNSSVATIPTLLDMVSRGQIENQTIKKGDVIIFASVGAGMNINAIVYEI